MSPPRPRRQFGPGTPGEWQRAMKSPPVQRALRDPAIAGALYKNFRGMGGSVPPQPEAPAHFDSGGVSQMDIDLQLKAAQDKQAADQKAGNAAAVQADQSVIDLLTRQRMNAQTAVAGIPGVSAGTSAGLQKLAQQGPPTPGNTAVGMGAGALLGLGSSRNPVAGALIGAATAGLLNYAIRKWGGGKKPASAGAGDASGVAGGNAEPNAVAPSPSATPSPGTSNTPAGTQTGPAAGTPGGTAAVEQKFDSPSMNNIQGKYDRGPSMDPNSNPNGQNLYMGTGNSPSGNLISQTGQPGSWIDEKTGQPFSGPVVNQTSIFGGGSPATDTSLAQLPTGTPAYMSDPSLSMAASDLGGSAAADSLPILDTPQAYMNDPSLGLKRGGRVKPPKAVLLRKPMGMPVPIHTTIVIALKPKGKKGKAPKKPETKRFGGVEVPRKPNAIPPERGPGNGYEGPVRKHGRVQVPRGFGAAIKGKRFGGIF